MWSLLAAVESGAKHRQKRNERERRAQALGLEAAAAKRPKIAEVVAQQAQVNEVQLRMAKEAKPGAKPTYVDAGGGLYKQLHIQADQQSKAAPRLPGAGVKFFVDCKIEKLPDRFRRVDKVRLADVLAVEDVKEALYTKQSLLAALWPQTGRCRLGTFQCFFWTVLSF